ncbi:Pentatricopeptide repeat-containing protein [Rhynchospora pubera]|uniref:Pentatricopeptide repeat-containing protein n=1 Tax=Rhynchospora pubera TaxID=906938 RepID=A0AAV8HHI9_9POAL|nr:Pentatricopeptide repeat-containing protein [Rhynchospora pubera]
MSMSMLSISEFISSHPSLSLLETRCSSMHHLRQLHSHLIRTGLARDLIATSRLISFTATSPSGDLSYALRLLSHFPRPNTFMYNTLIRALSRSSKPDLALQLFVEMLYRDTPRPDRLTFPSVFSSYSRLGWVDGGRELYGMVLKLGLADDGYIRNAVLAMYATCGCVDEAALLFDECGEFDVVSYNSMIMGLVRKGLVVEARALFDEMPERSVATWSSMISGYVRNGCDKEALVLFALMQGAGMQPNDNILTSLLGACANSGALDQGIWIHSYLENNGIKLNPLMATAIINMYCKCGELDKALEVFHKIPDKALSTWNSMISGLASHGRYYEATDLFSMLQESGLKPDNVTFVGILMSCGHSGMVDEAKYYFSLMSQHYGIEPEIQHYGCMVDTLGRAGLLVEAEDLIAKMPMEPDVAIWGALLSACRTHGNRELGDHAAKKVMELEARDSGEHATSSNILADCISSRLKIGKKGGRKERGGSTIEVNGVVHEFLAHGDFPMSHS